MRIAATVVFVALLGIALPAQTVERTFDLNALGWGPVSAPLAIETDGDLATLEWLVAKSFSTEKRVVAERNGGLCAGPWFSPTTSLVASIDVRRVGLIHKLFVTEGTITKQIALLTPTCG